MSIRTLFNIIFKILGIFFIRDILMELTQLLSAFYYVRNNNFEENLSLFILPFVILILYGVVSYFLIFKTDLIIKRLGLEKNFDEETISLNMHRSTVLSISVIVIGGVNSG